MRKMLGGVLVAVVGVLAVGCSSSSEGENTSPFGQEPDFNSISASYDSPSGTFVPTSSGPVLEGLAAEQTKQSQGGGFGGLGGVSGMSATQATDVGIQTVDILAEGESTSGFSCDALKSGKMTGSCACPKGGNFTYDISAQSSQQNAQSGKIDATLKYKYAACATDKITVDGSMFLKMQGETSKPKEMKTILVMKFTVKSAEKTATIDLKYAQVDGKVWFFLDAGGGVAVSSQGYNPTTKSGTIIIKDKNDTYTCVYTNGKGKCKGVKNPAEVDAS